MNLLQSFFNLRPKKASVFLPHLGGLRISFGSIAGMDQIIRVGAPAAPVEVHLVLISSSSSPPPLHSLALTLNRPPFPLQSMQDKMQTRPNPLPPLSPPLALYTRQLTQLLSRGIYTRPLLYLVLVSLTRTNTLFFNFSCASGVTTSTSIPFR